MSEYFGVKIPDIFNTQNERFRPEGAEGVEGVIAYDISGDGGGRWMVTIKDKACKTESVTGDLSGFTVKLSTDAETFAGVTIGKIDGNEAFTSGKVKVEGDFKLLMLLPRLFVKFSPAKKITARDIIMTMPERFRPDKAPGLDALLGYDLAGDGGGQWTAVVKDGKCEIEEGLRPNLTVCSIVKASDYVDLMLGKLDPMVAFGAGRLRLTGNMEVAMTLPKIFVKFEVKEVEAGSELIVLKKIISVDQKYSTGPVLGRFLKGLQDKKIYANVCPQCGRKQLPPREVCAVCRCWVYDFVEVGPEGMVILVEHTFYASPDPLTGETRETPYASIHMRLDGCKGTETFWHLLSREDLGDIKREDRVRPVWAENRTGSIFDIKYFEKIR